MIRVDRGIVPVPKVLDGPGSPGDRETRANISLYQKGHPERQKFRVYRDISVKAALGELFHRKCAYCEVVMMGQQQGDVDHFRPKAAIFYYASDGERVVEPGYFWLAASWENLLPSCVMCNRPNTIDDLFLDGARSRRVAGKASNFHLDKPMIRAGYPTPEVAEEKPLLLDPCSDDPSEHIRFTIDGLAVPAHHAGVPSLRGKETIRICGLNRAELVQLRFAVALEVGERLSEIIFDINRGSPPRAGDIAAVVRAMQPSSPFTSFVRSLVLETLQRNFHGF